MAAISATCSARPAIPALRRGTIRSDIYGTLCIFLIRFHSWHHQRNRIVVLHREVMIISKPRYRWWGYVKNVLRAYPALMAESEALHIPLGAAAMTGMPRGTGTSRPAEANALRQLDRRSQEELDAVNQAIAYTKTLTNGADRVEMINLIYFKQSHTIDGAALKLNYSERTARRYQADFIRLVAGMLGLL